jgi:RNA polymerase sigma-70 factor (ECF subfamily)
MKIDESWAALLPRLETDLSARATGDLGKDDDAWKSVLQLLRAYGRALSRSFSSLRPDQIEDLVQETLLKMQSPRTMKRLKLSGSPAGYVAVMMRNAATDLIRRQQRGREVEIDLIDELHLTDTADVQVVSSDRSERLQKALLLLNPGERALLQMRFWRGLSIAQIAEELGLSYSATAVRLFRILHRLRDSMPA